MRELLRSNDLVHLSWAQAALSAAGHRQCRARRPRQRRRGQHRSVSAPPDGRRRSSWSAPGKCSPGPNKRSRVAERSHRRSVCSAAACASASRRAAIASRSIRCCSPPRCRRGAGERVLDAGAGTGAASLCLAARVPECRIVGLELQRPLQRIASHNVDAERARRTGRDDRRRSGAAAAPAGRGQLRSRDDQSAPSGGLRRPARRPIVSVRWPTSRPASIWPSWLAGLPAHAEATTGV